ncbi:MAG: hypothetical protein LW860_16910 [Xanthomonadaceae bacterium]|jgi:hypothetical protein|nr:hypothetical protein [Xanthomonadaceae bacterium]
MNGCATIGTRDIAHTAGFYIDLPSLLDARVFMDMPGKFNACCMTGG